MPVLVLDACSTDSTQSLARSAGATVIERVWTDFVDARTFALQQVQTPWAFALDADETCDGTLAAAILACDGRYDGYAVLRDTLYRKQRLRMWRDESLVRLFNVESVRVEAHPTAGGSAALHERYCIDGPTGALPGHLIHNSYPTWQSYREKFNAYTQIEARGVPASFPRFMREIVLFGFRWARYVVVRGALLDGFDGILIAATSAAYPVVVQWRALTR